jgi:hypothetical protein
MLNTLFSHHVMDCSIYPHEISSEMLVDRSDWLDRMPQLVAFASASGMQCSVYSLVISRCIYSLFVLPAGLYKRCLCTSVLDHLEFLVGEPALFVKRCHAVRVSISNGKKTSSTRTYRYYPDCNPE